jgi:hypothetical protein
MIISGAVVLAFLALHFYDFWLHEINYKYVQGLLLMQNVSGRNFMRSLLIFGE